MTKQASIAYISGLMENPATLSSGDQGSIGNFRQSFPYFVPARYLEALQKHREQPFSPAAMSAVMPYMGNWMMFCDFMEAGTGKLKLADVVAKSGSTADVSPATPPTPAVTVVPDAEKMEPNVIETTIDPAVAVAANTPPVAPVLIDKDIAPDSITEVEATAIDEFVAESQPTNTSPIPEESILTEIAAEQSPEMDIAIKTEELENKAKNFWIQGDEDDTQSEQVEESSLAVETETTETLADIVPDTEQIEPRHEKPLIFPVYTDDYFLQQGEKIPNELPQEIESLKHEETAEDAAKSLMVMMSFSEWLLHFKSSTEKQKEENKDQRALKTMWQKEKLAAAIEEENEEIPESVFEMAVNSIAKEDGLASESLAEIYIKQGKYDKAMDMYRKLSLRNPQKNAYFARKIEEILKEKQS
jgi:tetratricopeptide (TPR) repeat protein